MLTESDEKGRYTVSGREYDATRKMITAINEMFRAEDALKERLKTVKNGWRDWKMIRAVTEKLQDSLLDTFPTKKLLVLRHELQNSHIEMKIDKAAKKIDNVVYIDEMAFVNLLNLLISQECWACEKRSGEVKRCPIRKAYFDCLVYGVVEDEKKADGSCEMAGWTNVLKEE